MPVLSPNTCLWKKQCPHEAEGPHVRSWLGLAVTPRVGGHFSFSLHTSGTKNKAYVKELLPEIQQLACPPLANNQRLSPSLQCHHNHPDPSHRLFACLPPAAPPPASLTLNLFQCRKAGPQPCSAPTIPPLSQRAPVCLPQTPSCDSFYLLPPCGAHALAFSLVSSILTAQPAPGSLPPLLGTFSQELQGSPSHLP